MLVFGVLMVAAPIVKIISAGEMYLTDFLPYVLAGVLGAGSEYHALGHIYKNRLQIAIGTKRDLFEAGMFKVPNVDEMRERFRKEIGTLTAVLDEMLAHERLFGPDAKRQEPSKERGAVS
jgi:hypothetical protein